jgi:hypothetical protein
LQPEVSTIIKQIFDLLPPEGQKIFGTVILTFGVFIMIRAWIEGKTRAIPVAPAPTAVQRGVGEIPSWVLVGPMHDMMQSVHEVAEQGRVTNELLKTHLAVLRDLDKTLTEMDRGQNYTHRLMEETMRDKDLENYRRSQSAPRGLRKQQ